MLRLRRNLALGLVAALCGAATARAQDSGELWETEPYRIRMTLAIDAPGHLAEQLAAELPALLDERTAASIGRVWRLETQLADGALRHRVLRHIDALDDNALTGDGARVDDKQLFVSIAATPWGYELAAREFDRYMQRWGATLRSTVRQREALGESLFALVRRAVAPLARLDPDPGDPKRMMLTMRGGAVPPRSVDFRWAEPGEVFLPLLRRTTRDGVLVEGGVQVVPWTYLQILSDGDVSGNPSARAGQAVAQVRSGLRRPLGVRRRARTEEVAIALRADPAETTLALRSRTEKDKPLVGYEVEAQDAAEEEPRPIGVSDERGEVRVAPGESSIQTVSISSAGNLLARVPVVPGAEPVVVLPLPDDSARLQAAARLAALREDLIDVVARRNIFMARVRQRIEEGNYDQARRLLESLDELPGRTRFNQRLEREQRQLRSNDPQIQRRIDQLFAATQLVLGQFLDPRPIGELHEELREAEQRSREANTSRADVQLSAK